MMREENDITHYWPESAEVQADGTINIRITGWEPGRGHWGGSCKIKLESPEYDFWRWVVENKVRWPNSFTNADLPSMRAEHAEKSG